MKIRTLIIDDEPIALEKLGKYVEQTPQLILSAACTDCFAAMEYLCGNDVDLIITDINMPDLNGLDFIKSLNPLPLVIFTTAYQQYAIEGYKVSAVDYLLKPYGYAEFFKAVSKAIDLSELRNREQISQSADGSIFLKVDYRYVRVSLSDIQYIKGYGEYLQIYLAGKPNPLIVLSSFAKIKEALSTDFIQIHRSYIVNMNHVKIIERGRVLTDDDIQLPVGDSYKIALQEYLSSRSIGKNGK